MCGCGGEKITHGIKLHPPGAPTTISAAADTTTPVVSEVYDEVVFTDPNENFFQQLQDVRNVLSIETEYSQHKHFTQFSDTNDTLALLEAQNFVQRQLSEAKERLKLVDDDLEQVENNLIVAREQQQQQRAAAAAAAVAPANAKNNNSNANRLPSHKTSGKSKTSIDSGNTSTANDGAVAKGPPSKKVKQK